MAREDERVKIECEKDRTKFSMAEYRQFLAREAKKKLARKRIQKRALREKMA